MAAPDLTQYFDNIAAIRARLLALGKWDSSRPYSALDDAELQKYYDEKVAKDRTDLLGKIDSHSQETIDQYYNSTVPKERKQQQPSENFIQDQIINRAIITAKNAALSKLFQDIEQSAKKVSDRNIASYYSSDANNSNVAEAREDRLGEEKGQISTFNEKRSRSGLTTGSTVDKKDSQFNFNNEEPEISVPTEKFLTSNPDKMALFKQESGAKDIPDLYKKNEDQGKKVKLFGESRDKNRFVNPQVKSLSTFPVPGEDIASQNKIGETIANEQVFKIGQTPLEKSEKIHKSWIPRKRPYNIGRSSTPSNTATQQNELTAQKINQLLKEQNPTVGSYKFFIEKLHGRYQDAGGIHPYKRNEVKSRAGELRPPELENRMVFPAYVTAYNDSYDSSYDSYDFIGRGEPFWAWKSTTRTLTMEFYMMSDISTQILTLTAKEVEKKQQDQSGDNSGKDPNGVLNSTINLKRTVHDVSTVKDGVIYDAAGNPLDDIEIEDKEKFQAYLDLFPDWGLGTTPISNQSHKGRSGFVAGEISGTPDQLWERTTFLAQCVYGWYRKDGKLKEQPVVRIRIADFFDVTAIITSLNFTQDEFDVDLNLSDTVGAIPTGIKVSISATILHEDEPHSEYRKFYHRKDRDAPVEKDQHKTEGPGPTGDAIMNSEQSKSPFQSVAKNLKNRKAMDFPAEAAVYQAGLKNLDKSLVDLKASGGSLNDAAKREKLTQALKAGLRYLKLKQAFDALELPATALESKGLKKSMANQPLKTELGGQKLFGNKKPNDNPIDQGEG